MSSIEYTTRVEACITDIRGDVELILEEQHAQRMDLLEEGKTMKVGMSQNAMDNLIKLHSEAYNLKPRVIKKIYYGNR